MAEVMDREAMRARLKQLDISTLPFHPLANEFELIDEEGLLDLAETIADPSLGLIFDIVRYDGQILEGRNRYIACLISGTRPRVVDLDPEADPAFLANYVDACNIHRRHDTVFTLARKRRERLERIAAHRVAGRSLRDIAMIERISVTRVRDDLEKAKALEIPCEPAGGKVEASNGRTVKAKQNRKPKAEEKPPAEPESEPESESEEFTAPPPPANGEGKPKRRHEQAVDRPAPGAAPKKPEPLVGRDAAGATIPDHLSDVFADPTILEITARMRELARLADADSLKRACEKLTQYNAHLATRMSGLRIQVGEAHECLAAATLLLEDSMPYAVCPACKGHEHGCADCAGAGWIGRRAYEELIDRNEASAELEAGATEGEADE
jgi:hypothetical protein